MKAKEFKKTEDNETKYTTIFVIIVSALARCLYASDIGAIGGALGLITKEMNLLAGQ
jgi:hypothetical protein